MASFAEILGHHLDTMLIPPVIPGEVLDLGTEKDTLNMNSERCNTRLRKLVIFIERGGLKQGRL